MVMKLSILARWYIQEATHMIYYQIHTHIPEYK